MWKKFAPILSIFLWCMIVADKSEAKSAASASAAAVAGYLDHEPVQHNPVVDSLARFISAGLLHSQVFGGFANFKVYKPYDLFFIAGTNFLTKANIYDPFHAKIPADAGVEVGLVSSELYFDTVGYTVAKFLFAKGVAAIDNVEYLSLRIVTEIEIVACTDGLMDTLSVMNAVVYGVFNVVDWYGLITHENVAELFYLFAEEIEALSGIVSK